MDKKLIIAVLVPLMILIVAAYGYASFTSTVTETVNASAGTLIPVFTNFAVGTNPSYLVVNDVGTVSPNLVVNAGPFRPGDVATFYFQITNEGNIPFTLSGGSPVVNPISGGGWSSDLAYSDNVAGTVLNPGQTSSWFTATVTFSSTPVGSPGATYDIVVTVTAS